MVIRTVQGNLNNGAANRLEVVEDTTDVALFGIAPREVADADRTVFFRGLGTNEVADVSVIEASDHISPGGIANDCVITAINVVKECRRPNCRVAIGQTEGIRIIISKRVVTRGGVSNTVNI